MARDRLMDAIRRSVRETADYTGLVELSDRVMDAMAATPRDRFVDTSQRRRAWDNTALPISDGQTISQPLIVALMTELLEPEPGDVILEVGTGSGYQAAVLSPLVKHIYTIEIIDNLANTARARLDEMGYDNVTVRAGDGYAGWPEHAPFDGIVVTAAAEEIPPPLLQQLKPGGKLVIPVGEHGGYQELLVVETNDQGEVSKRSALPDLVAQRYDRQRARASRLFLGPDAAADARRPDARTQGRVKGQPPPCPH
ncbi:MAG: protein-L-isoaspartate(D-aspartate) O-methyltransferase, partial [Halioglobus sp.]|nr:protein-L-isoaspartate(D-aspartate) O-methyltransferase [Halioglobus sp.]